VKLTTHPRLLPRSKNEWRYTSTPQYAFMAWCLVKAQGQLYLYLLPFHLISLRYQFISHSTFLFNSSLHFPLIRFSSKNFFLYILFLFKTDSLFFLLIPFIYSHFVIPNCVVYFLCPNNFYNSSRLLPISDS
jgi:hypothetical protein